MSGEVGIFARDPESRLRSAIPLESSPRADVAQLVEHWLPKPGVVGSSPIVRFDKALQIEL